MIYIWRAGTGDVEMRNIGDAVWILDAQKSKIGCGRYVLQLAWWDVSSVVSSQLGGGFKHFLFSPLFGEDFQFD